MSDSGSAAPAPYQHEGSFRDRARQAIATGDQAAARALLHQLFVQETPIELSTSLTEAVVATARAAEDDAEARARYQQTRRELNAWLEWLETSDLDSDDLARLRHQVDRRAARLETEAKDRKAAERALLDSQKQRRQVGGGWLEVKRIPRPNGQLSAPYLYYRARARGRLKSVYIGKLA